MRRNCSSGRKKAENPTPEIASEYIAGYTIANDFGLHDFRETDQNSMVRVKGFRSLGCVGPDIACDWDYRNKGLKPMWMITSYRKAILMT